jgi:hypothetical protein
VRHPLAKPRPNESSELTRTPRHGNGRLDLLSVDDIDAVQLRVQTQANF